MLFFFSVGAQFLLICSKHHFPSIVLAIMMLLLKPVIFSSLFEYVGEQESESKEVGIRLGQISEFSLLVAYIAYNAQLFSKGAYTLVQAATIITFFISSYVVVRKYRTPIADSGMGSIDD